MAVNKPTEPCPDFDYANWQATVSMVRAPNNRRMTKSLFKEMISPAQLKKYRPVYTLCEHEQWEAYHGFWLPSAKQIYLHSSDEYEAAKRLVCSIEHWNYLIKLDWFVDGVDNSPSWTSLSQWREEHKIARESHALALLRKKANEGNVQAIKALLDYSTPSKRGRPSKAEVVGEKKKQATAKKDHDNDADRIMRLIK